MRETPLTAFATRPDSYRDSKNVKDTGTIRREDPDEYRETLRDFKFRTCKFYLYELNP
jgi:hypothetical protein